MTSPAYVGAGLNYDVDTAMPTSLTIPTPSGVAWGDRVLAFVCCTGGDAADPADVWTCSTPTGWTLADSAQLTGIGTSGGSVAMFILSGRWVGSGPSVTVTRASGSANTYRIHSVAFRPSAPVNETETVARSATSTQYRLPSFSNTYGAANGSTVMYAQFAELGALSGGPSFSSEQIASGLVLVSRITQLAISGRGGPFRLSTMNLSSNFTVGDITAWTRTPAAAGTLTTLTLEAPSDDPPLGGNPAADWGVDRIAW